MTIREAFKDFYRNFPRHQIERAIEFFACFGGGEPLFIPDTSQDLIDNLTRLFESYSEIKPLISVENEHLLSAFATGDRRIESTIRKSFLSEAQGYAALSQLIEGSYIRKVLSRERLPKKEAKRRLKKELRRYRIQHKVAFTRPFYRFWYRYIYPNEELLLNGEGDLLLSIVLDDLDNFVSLLFEELSNELLQERFGRSLSSGSYWDRKVEIDIYMELPNGESLVGECKWKNSKICKQTLNSLKKRAAIAGIEPTYYALFSKSGFSNELLKMGDRNLLLFDLEDFKEWSEETVYRKREKRPYSFEF
ncbi:MAG: DUF234 domain-containing protein [Epsilonproteobacteria bacterium]|nr:DUF234 domain-containing protein [Campylobacterota bacterium]